MASQIMQNTQHKQDMLSLTLCHLTVAELHKNLCYFPCCCGLFFFKCCHGSWLHCTGYQQKGQTCHLGSEVQ